MYKNVIKRTIDIALSAFGLIILLPVFIITALLIYIDDPGPVLFKQQRMGKDKKPFWMYKFRSMKMNTPQIPGYLFDDADSYITRIGHIIRTTSIDELPQIYNILLGNMSIIGYRPSLYKNEELLVVERDKYNVHCIKPGLTGWAQINGRDELPVSVKAKLDGEYKDFLNNGGFTAFAMDLKCFIGTILKVLKHEGIVEGRNDSPKVEKKEVIHR